METNYKNFSILIENEQQFNKVWLYVRYYFPNYKDIEYNEFNPVGVIFDESPTWVKLMQNMDENIHTRISWKQFLEYEKKMEKKEEQKVIPIKKALEQLSKEKKNKELIASLIKKINILISNLPDNEALKVTFNSEGEDMKFYLDNLTKFTSLKSIFNSKELL